MSFTLTRASSPARDFEEGRGVRLLGIADYVVGLDHLRESFRLDLGGAACDDDLGAGPLAARLADRLPGLAHGLGRHRASVDDYGAVEPRLLGELLRHLALEVFSRQPNEMTSTLMARAPPGPAAIAIELERAFELELGWPGHEDMIVSLAPFDEKHAAGKLHLTPAARCARSWQPQRQWRKPRCRKRA